MVLSFSMIISFSIGILVLKLRFMFSYTYDLAICVQNIPYDIGLIFLANLMKPQEIPLVCELILIISFFSSDNSVVPKDMNVYEAHIPRHAIAEGFLEGTSGTDANLKTSIKDVKTPIVVLYPSEKDSTEKNYMIGYRVDECESKAEVQTN